MDLKKLFLTIATLFLIVNAQSAKCILYLIEPAFEASTLGAKITDDERTELYSMLSEGCSGVFKTTVTPVSPSALEQVKTKGADFLIWDILHYHFLCDDDQHEACLKATLYRFSASNNYTYPVFAATPPMVLGNEMYGDLAPFREGIDEYFSALRRYLRNNKTGDPKIPKASAEDILNNDPLRNAASKVFVLVSPLNESTIGSQSLDYEIFHLPGMIAHYVGILIQKTPVVIDETAAARLKEQSIVAKVARVDLHTCGNGDRVLDLDLYQSPDLANPVFRISVKDPTKNCWRINEDFQAGLEIIFKTITQHMESAPDVGNLKIR